MGFCRSLAKAAVATVVICSVVLGCAWITSEERFNFYVAEGLALQSKQPGGSREVSRDLLYLGWCNASATRAEVQASIVEDVVVKLLTDDPDSLVVYVVDSEATESHAALNLSPIAPPVCAHIQVKPKGGDLTAAASKHLEVLRKLPVLDTVHAYIVDSSTHTDYGEYAGPATAGWDPKSVHSWGPGTRSPGVACHTMFPQAERFKDRDEWVARWFSTQSPMSEMIQPRQKYVRNVVQESLTTGAPAYGGIVIEIWPSAMHMNNPFYFFNANDPWELFVHICVMLRGISVLDFSTIQGIVMGEYIFA